MVFTGDNHAWLVDENGNDVQELTTITTRATEYTTPESMPAVLPPTSAYTYCVELSVDGAQRVRFEKPVTIWVDNFLGFDVGEIVPVGYYDRDKGVWVPSDNGVVAKLLDTDSDGIVDALDANGDDQADDLNSNGSFSDEVKGLEDSTKYPPDSTFWRMTVTHFSPEDCNWPYGPPTDAIPPNPEEIATADQQNEEPIDCQLPTGSFVEERSRIFHEDISIPGMEIDLHYASNRVEGYKTAITVPASGETIPASLKSIIVNIKVAGRTFEQILDPLPSQNAKFIWDRLDYLGNPGNGFRIAIISVGFIYDAVYYTASNIGRAFAQAGDEVTAIRARQEVISWKHSNLIVYSEVKGVIAEGWTISTHNQINLQDLGTLHKGDGTISKNNAMIIDTVAGNGQSDYSGDGGPGVDAKIYNPYNVAVDALGNLYITTGSRIRKVNRDGIITTVAGNGSYGYSGDGGPAIDAQLNSPCGIAFDSIGTLFVADRDNHRIRKIDRNGIIETVAGTGIAGFSGDGGLASQVSLTNPVDVAVDAWGNLYINEQNSNRISKVDSAGIIRTVAGNGIAGYSGDGGPAREAQLNIPSRIALDNLGNLFIADLGNNRIRKVNRNGIIETVAGTGIAGFSGDGGLASQSELNHPGGMAIDGSGNIYFADYLNHRIRRVNTNGIISTLAGNGIAGYGGDGGIASEAYLYRPADLSLDVKNNIYIADAYNARVRKITSHFYLMGTDGGSIFFEEGGLGYIVSNTGLHKTTIDLDTGAILREFGYDKNNDLISITDQFGNQTIINWGSNGVPTSIISPDGLTTHFVIDADKHLTRITYPDGGFYGFEYTPDGLMTAKIEPEGNRFEHDFDSNGKLTDATDEEGGHWEFTRTASTYGGILSEVLTGEGNLTSYLDHTDSTGAYSSTITDPTGTETLFSESGDGLTVNKSLPCGMDLEFKYGVDSDYKFKFVKEMTETTPSGLEKVTLRDKTYQDTNADDTPDLIMETVTVNDKSTTFENNVLLSQKAVTSSEGRTITILYDPSTLVPENMSIPGLFDTAYGYNTKGRLTSITNNTRQTAFSYNAQGFLESVTEPGGYTTIYTHDPVGRTTGISRPDGSSVGFTYDKNGNTTVLTNPSAIDHGFGYNKVNLNSSYQTSLSGSYTYVYDKDRRLKQTNFPSGNQINNIYANGRLEQIQTPEGNIDFTYLCAEKVGSITNGSESITYGYDGKLVTSESSSGTLNQALGFTYNDDFNLTSLSYAGETNSYIYDNDGWLIGAGSLTIFRNAENGLPETVTGGSLNLSRTFNGYGEVDAQDYSIGGQYLSSWNLTRDNNGRITNKTETIDSTTSDYVYTYDPMGRLLTVTKNGDLVEEYQYNANGTRIYEMKSLREIADRNFSYDNEDHLLTAGSAVYSYNLDGFLAAKTDGSEVTTYDYSSRGELLAVTFSDGRIIEYVHDPLGRRIAKKVSGIIVEKYLWQGLTRLLAVYDGSDNQLMRFEYAEGRMPVAMTKNGSTYYLTYDQVGSLRIVADASGYVVKRIDYDSFGNIIDDTNPAFEVPFGFAGGLHDQDTGLVRFGYRDYDLDTGRWTAKDPIFFYGGNTDLYGYCLNNPINRIDPLGLYLNPTQQIKVSIASGFGSAVGYAVGTLAGAPNLGSAFGGLVASAIAAKSMEGSTWQNVANSAISGGLSGLTGSSIGSLLRGTLMNNIQTAAVTGITSGMFDALLLGADPVFKEPDAKNTPCN
jgi:RHS repeat-associated protein